MTISMLSIKYWLCCSFADHTFPVRSWLKLPSFEFLLFNVHKKVSQVFMIMNLTFLLLFVDYSSWMSERSFLHLEFHEYSCYPSRLFNIFNWTSMCQWSSSKKPNIIWSPMFCNTNLHTFKNYLMFSCKRDQIE